MFIKYFFCMEYCFLYISYHISKVAAFIKSERPARYPGLTIKYVRGADPIIKVRLLD